MSADQNAYYFLEKFSVHGQFPNVPEASFIAAPELIPPYPLTSSDPRVFMPLPMMSQPVPAVISPNIRPQMSLPPALAPMSSGIGFVRPHMHLLMSTVPPYASTVPTLMPRGPPLMPSIPAIMNPAMVPSMQPLPMPLAIPPQIPHPVMGPGFYNAPVPLPMTGAPVSPVESYPGMPYPVLYPIPAFENFRIGEGGIVPPTSEPYTVPLVDTPLNPSKERRRFFSISYFPLLSKFYLISNLFSFLFPYERERNKLLARKTRQKKKVETENLKDRIAALALENEKLRTIIHTDIPQLSAAQLIQSDVSLPDNVHQLLKQMISIEEKSILTELSMKQKSFCIVNPVAKGSPIVYVSPGFLTLTGYSREECIGKNCRFLQGPETDKIEVSYQSIMLIFIN
jgi:PAS domain-containing protein